ncbi:MAG: hypothetical protein ACRDV8_08865 [Acidimicrobiales bacterium]
MHRHGSLFQEVALGLGRTVVRFSFLPPHEEAALWMLVARLVALVAGWALGRRRLVPRRLRAPPASRS